MISLYTLVVLLCALFEARAKARAKARDDLRKLVYASYSTKSQKRVKEILSKYGLLLEFAGNFAKDEEICCSAIKQNPYALQFVPCNSEDLLRKMTNLAWKVAEERGLDMKPLLSYSVNVPVVFNFITETIESGAFDSISVPKWYFYCPKGQLVLARKIGEDHVKLVELINRFGVCVLKPFLLHTYEHLGKSLEKKCVVDTYVDLMDSNMEFKSSFPFNNLEVFEAVFRINPWTALNYFKRELWHGKIKVFDDFLRVNARDALKFFNH